MKLGIYSIYDHKAEAYNTPVFIAADAQAIRLFGDQVQEPGAMFNKHPQDFVLYKLGSVHLDTGKVESEDTPVPLASGIDFNVQRETVQ